MNEGAGKKEREKERERECVCMCGRDAAPIRTYDSYDEH